MYLTKTLTGQEAVFRQCVTEDIQRHFERIEEVIEPELRDKHIERMHHCVADGTAFVTSGDECFLYYEKTEKPFADGISIYGKGNPALMIAMMSGIFRICDKETLFIYIRLHKSKDINEYKGMLSKTALYRHKANGDRLLIRTDNLLAKFDKLAAGRKQRE